ncbi:MAG: hypothetical protein R3291_04245, partial [Thermoplasmata archaeon]|nr:hypothetical protein [Thermoplasmata archaeon]
ALESYQAAIAGHPDAGAKARLHNYASIDLRLLGRWEEGRQEIERGLALGGPGPSLEVANLLLSKSIYDDWAGREEESDQVLEEVGRWLAELPPDPETRYWWTERSSSSANATTRDYPAVLERGREAVRLYEATDFPPRVRHFAQCYLLTAWASFLLGRMEEALSWLDRGWADQEAIGGVVQRGNYLSMRGYILSEGQGRFEEAEERYGEALQWMKRANQAFRSAWLPHLFAKLYAHQGRREEARESLAFFLGKAGEALGSREVQGALYSLEPEDLMDSHAFMARLCIDAGDLEAAEEQVSTAEAFLDNAESNEGEFAVTWARALVHRYRGEHEEARGKYEAARALPAPPIRGYIFQRLFASEFLRAEFLLDYGRFLASQGEEAQASKVLTEALKEARENSRAPLQAKVEQELSALNAA